MLVVRFIWAQTEQFGIPVCFYPTPQFDVKPDLPKGYFDFIGLLTHEIFHCLGFYGATDQWKNCELSTHLSQNSRTARPSSTLGERVSQ